MKLAGDTAHGSVTSSADTPLQFWSPHPHPLPTYPAWPAGCSARCRGEVRWATPGGLGGGWPEETSRVGLGCKVGVKEADHILYLYNSFLLTPRGRNHIYLGQEGDRGAGWWDMGLGCSWEVGWGTLGSGRAGRQGMLVSLSGHVIGSWLPYFRSRGSGASRRSSHSAGFHGDSWKGCQMFNSFQRGWKIAVSPPLYLLPSSPGPAQLLRS